MLCAVAVSASAFFAFGCAASGYTVFSERAVFSDDILFSAKLMGGRASYAYDRMCDLLRDIDGQVSLTVDSDLSKFNAAEANERVEVGKYCYEIYLAAREYYTLTDGAYNCAVAPLSRLWHVDAASLDDVASSDGDVELPNEATIEAVLPVCSPLNVEAEELDGRYYITKTVNGVELDFGGIAKGYAVDKCVEILREYNISSALLDISGNAYFYGDYVSNGKSGKWNVGVTSPRPRTPLVDRGYVCALELDGNASAVTSGDYMRYYVVHGDGNVYIPHIIGRNGVPIGVCASDGKWINSDEYVISATVIGQCSAMCDALSTAVCVLGMERGRELLQKVGCKGLIFTEKRYTIIESVLYRPDYYDGYKAYALYEP